MISAPMRALTALHTREFVRSRSQFYFVLLFPLGTMALFIGLGLLMTGEDSRIDPWAQLVPLSMFLALTGTTLLATASPWAALRVHGQMRLLSTTPVPRSTILISHTPVRVVTIVGVITLIVVVGMAIDVVEPANAAALIGVGLLGVPMFGALGYLIGGLVPSTDVANNLGTILQLVLMFTCGLVLPLEVFPDTVASVLAYVPTTFYADLLMGLVEGGETHHPVWVSVLVVLGTALVLALLAVRTFRWHEDA